MATDGIRRDPSHEADDVLSVLRQLDSQLRQRREYYGMPETPSHQPPPAMPHEPVSEQNEGDGGAPPASRDELLSRLHQLADELHQVQLRVSPAPGQADPAAIARLEELETHLREIERLLRNGQGEASIGRSAQAGATIGSGTASDLAGRREGRPVQLPSTILPGSQREPAPTLHQSGGLPHQPGLPPLATQADQSPPAGFAAPHAAALGAAPLAGAQRSAAAAPTAWYDAVDEPAADPAWPDALEGDEVEGGGRARWPIVLAIAVAVIVLVAAAIFVPRLLMNQPPASATPDAPPPAAGGGRIVFQSDRETPGQPQLFIVRADGGGVTRLPISLPYAWHPAFSPDGKRIAFIGRVGGVDDIYIVDADGRNLQRVTNKAGNNRHPVWSPDGTRLAFGSDRSGNWDIYIARLDGSDVRNLTDAPSDDNLPTWSPDGKSLAFQSDRSGRMQIYVVDATGGQAVNISRSRGDDAYPRWAPAGDAISFYSNRDGNKEIYVMNPDGSGQQNMTNHPANDELAVWSADSRRLIFASDRDGDQELYSLNLDNGEVQRLTTSPSHDWAPSWGR